MTTVHDSPPPRQPSPTTVAYMSIRPHREMHFKTNLEVVDLQKLLLDSCPTGLAGLVTPWEPVEGEDLPSALDLIPLGLGGKFRFGVRGEIRGGGAIGDALADGGMEGLSNLRGATTNLLVISGSTDSGRTTGAAQMFNDSPMNKRVLKRFSKGIKSSDRSAEVSAAIRP